MYNGDSSVGKLHHISTSPSQPERSAARSYICILDRSKLRAERARKSLAQNS